jgi:hypothetical protein
MRNLIGGGDFGKKCFLVLNGKIIKDSSMLRMLHSIALGLIIGESLTVVFSPKPDYYLAGMCVFALVTWIGYLIETYDK